MQLGLHGQYRRVEPFQMPRLQDALVFGGPRQQIIGFRQGGGEWLLHQQIEPAIKQSRGNRMVLRGRHSHTCCINSQVCSQQFLYRCKNGNRILLFGLGGAARIRLNRGNQCDTLPRSLQLPQDAEMVAAKRACPGYYYAQNGFVERRYAPLPSTTLRQRE